MGTLKKIEKGEYEVTAEGSLGLLALGDVGLKVWREKRGPVKPPVQPKKKNESKKEDKQD